MPSVRTVRSAGMDPTTRTTLTACTAGNARTIPAAHGARTGPREVDGPCDPSRDIEVDIEVGCGHGQPRQGTQGVGRLLDEGVDGALQPVLAEHGVERQQQFAAGESRLAHGGPDVGGVTHGPGHRSLVPATGPR